MARLTQAERKAIWQQRVDRFVHSQQSVVDFCKSEGISVPSFYQWKRRLAAGREGAEAPNRKAAVSRAEPSRRQQRSTQFAELVVIGEEGTAQARLPNGISISLGRDSALAAAIVDRLVAYRPAKVDAASSPASGRPC